MADNELYSTESIAKEWLKSLMAQGHIKKITPEFIEAMVTKIGELPVSEVTTKLYLDLESTAQRLMKTQTQLTTMAVMQANTMNVLENLITQGIVSKETVDQLHEELLPKTRKELINVAKGLKGDKTGYDA